MKMQEDDISPINKSLTKGNIYLYFFKEQKRQKDADKIARVAL